MATPEEISAFCIEEEMGSVKKRKVQMRRAMRKKRSDMSLNLDRAAQHRASAGADVLEFLIELQARMKADGVTQADLAKRIDVERSQISRWLREEEVGLNARSMFLLARGVGYELRQGWIRSNSRSSGERQLSDEFRGPF